ncbi:MlaD family protein [Tundrisphaera sp. TA3]|uniref:MlaD family protein n=1 Tax=Tundrisphaera sp. TA3 TaxID=3435775 RepID=UPI003EBA520E
MRTRTSGREIWAGLVVVLALGAMFGLFAIAGGGPGFLAKRFQIDVDFRDGQGIRPGSQVRIAGIDAGRVVDVTLAEIEGVLHARVRLAIPDDLAARLRSDAKITIQSSLTGQSRVNIVSAGRSDERLAANQVLRGVETTLFDPILEQVGLGPVERKHLSHTIAQVRETVDLTTPKVREIVAAVSDTTNGLRATSEAIRPRIETTAEHVEETLRRVSAATPKVEQALTRAASLSANVDAMLAENRPNIQATVAGIKELSATLKAAVDQGQPKVAKLLDNVESTRARADIALFQAGQLGESANQMLSRNKTDIERTIANVKDATDWGSKLVQKIYANPFVLSPLYKPTPEDIRVQVVYDSAQVFAKGAQELDDAVRKLEAIQSRPNNAAQQRQEIEQIRRLVSDVTGRLGAVSQQLSEGLKPRTRR